MRHYYSDGIWHWICKHSSFCDELDAELVHYWDKITDVWYFWKNGIISTWHWLPVIWNDRNWDSSHVYRIFEKKLRLQAAAIEKYGHHLYKERDVKNMLTCAALLKRLYEEDYLFNIWHDKLEKEFGHITFEDHTISRKKIKTPADEKRASWLLKKAAAHERLLMKQDLELFGKIFAKHSKEWWD